jgi:ADP-ribosylglycohydrolase
MELSDRVRGRLYGLLIGDALGVPYEFQAAGIRHGFSGIPKRRISALADRDLVRPLEDQLVARWDRASRD